jgi:hypothetical protein
MSDWYDCLLCGIYQILRVNIYLWSVHTMFAFSSFVFFASAANAGRCLCFNQ